MITEKIEQLPKDIKDYISDVVKERDTALQVLGKHINNQARYESPPPVVTNDIQSSDISLTIELCRNSMDPHPEMKT